MSEKDFRLTVIEVTANPILSTETDLTTGEVKFGVRPSNHRVYELPIILRPDGLPLYPHNQYLYSRLKENLKGSKTEAQALMAFERFLSKSNLAFDSLSDIPEDGAAWLFTEHLIKNLKQVNVQTGEVLKNPNGYALSTARSYVRIVCRFYGWLHSNGLFFITRDKKPFEHLSGYRKRSRKNNDHNMLSHLYKQGGYGYKTTTLMKLFPKIQSIPDHLRLKPMSLDDKEIFINHLKTHWNTGKRKTVALMLRLAIETGLREDEIVTFPASGIHYPTTGASVIPFIIGPINGCKTKYDKQRTIAVPYPLMLELHEYLHKQGRAELLKKGMNNLMLGHQKEMQMRKAFHEENGSLSSFQEIEFKEEDHLHGRLFIHEGGLPYSKKSISVFMSEIRAEIRELYPNWYYRPHDLRSTFATLWLMEQATRRRLMFDFLMQELAALMGHNSTSTTEKYINFCNSNEATRNFALAQNKLANLAVRK
jgi:integrase